MQKSVPFETRLTRRLLRLRSWMDRDMPLGKTQIYGVAGLAFVALMLAAAGIAFNNNFLVDFFFAMDQAWRMQLHQMPYQDFRTPVGPFYYFLLWASGQFFTPPIAVITAPLFAAIALGPLTLWALWRRFTAKPALIMWSIGWLSPLAPKYLDGVFVDVSWLAFYNSLCLPLAMAVMAISLMPNIRPKARPVLEGLALGILVILLFATKFTYGILGVGMVVVGTLLWRHWIQGGLAIFMTAMAFLGVYLGAHDLLMLHWEQLQDVANANNPTARFWGKTSLGRSSSLLILILSFSFVWLLIQYQKERPKHPTHGRAVYATLFMMLTAYAAVLNDHPDTPILVLPGMWFAWNYAMRYNMPLTGGAGRTYRLQKWVILGIVPVMMAGWWGINSVGSLGTHFVLARVIGPYDWQFETTNGAKFGTPIESMGTVSNSLEELMKQDDQSPTRWHNTIRSGIEDLQRLGLQHRRIFISDFSNPFPMLLGAEPPKGVYSWMDPGRSMSYINPPPFEHIFGDSEVWMSPRYGAHKGVDRLIRKFYQDRMDQEFTLLEETEFWKIYIRKIQDTPPSSATSLTP